MPPPAESAGARAARQGFAQATPSIRSVSEQNARLPYVLQEKRCVLKRCAGELLIGWQVSVRSRKGSLGGCRWVCESENAKTRPASRIFEPYQLAQATSAASSAAVAAQNIMPQAAGANVPMDANMSAADVFCRTSAKPIDETDLKRSWENYVGRLMTP